MPFLLVRDGKLVVQDTRLARESCTQCCEGSEPLWFEVADCCYPNQTFWVLTTQQLRGEQGLQPFYTPGVPVTINLTGYCNTSRPDVTRTYDEIVALDPDATFVVWPPGFEPDALGNCDDPRCVPCPQCCILNHIPANRCGGPLCCEHGGTFTVSINVVATAQQFRRAYGWNAPGFVFCGTCLNWSEEGQSYDGVSTYTLVVRFVCGSDGRYTGTCLSGRRTRTDQSWMVEVPQTQSCEPLPTGFAPTRTLLVPGNQQIDETIECGNLSAPQLFGLDWLGVSGLVPGLGHVDGVAPTRFQRVVRFGVDCSGNEVTSRTIDRTFTSSQCEQALSALGNEYRTTHVWSGSQNCDGGNFTLTSEYQGGFTTRFLGFPFVSWITRSSYQIQASWSIEREGRPTCGTPQCVDNPGGLPPLLFDRRAAVPAVKQSEARKGCSSCGKGEGL